MLTSARTVAFIPSTDLERSRAFYEETLGLPVVSVDSFAVVLQAGDVTIRLTDVGSVLNVQPFTILGWEVDDIHATIRGLTAKGVTFIRVEGVDQDDAGVWTAPGGAQVAWFHDPDENTLSLDHV